MALEKIPTSEPARKVDLKKYGENYDRIFRKKTTTLEQMMISVKEEPEPMDFLGQATLSVPAVTEFKGYPDKET